MLRRILLELSRVILGSVFVVSGVFKATDPMGASLKITDYISSALGSSWVWLVELSMFVAILLCILEFMLGAMLLMGIYRRIVTRASFALMVGMTLVTLYIYWTGVLPDCGCFGDVIKLSNGASLIKNLILLPLSYALMVSARSLGHLFSRRERWLPAALALLGISYFIYQNYYYLPYKDLRPYRIGYNLREKIEEDEAAYQAALFEGTKYIYKRDGREQGFNLDALPDSSWTYVRLEQDDQLKSYKPTYFFELRNDRGDHMEDEILQDSIGTILLLSISWVKADQRRLSEINELYRYAKHKGYNFYGVSASTPEEEAEWRYQTGADYPILFADASTIKTMVRANPALILLKKGVIKDKISVAMLPSLEQLSDYVESRMVGSKTSLPSRTRLLPLVVWGLILGLALLRIVARRLNILGYKARQDD
ncbi:MAG: DoxX family protein [Porphyromonadaceae bacterium]|nr:DoxX family protein [Porphyromonadaceae bacterium]